jgi:glycosyltransferase involved in cell wall biosynthesis
LYDGTTTETPGGVDALSTLRFISVLALSVTVCPRISPPLASAFVYSLSVDYDFRREIAQVVNFMQQKLFSIITPTYNSGRKLEKTIRSVLSQNKDIYEYIILDGCSTDETASVAAKYATEITFVSEKDEGVYDAMNKGIDLASGKYLYFLGAGDTLKTNILERIAPRMPHDELTFVYGNVYMVDRGVIYDGEFDKAKLRKYNICHQAVFYERAIFETVGRYELRFEVLADYVFNVKCFWNDRVQKKYIGYVIANFEGGGLSSQQRDLNFVNEYSDLIAT